MSFADSKPCDNCDHNNVHHDENGCKMGRLTNNSCACMLGYWGTWVCSGCMAPEHTQKEGENTVRRSCLLRAGHEGNQHRHREYRWYANVANPDRTKVADTQVGGGHYRETPLQPWDVIDAWNLDFYAGNALKYLYRAGRKGARVEDLKKARHYLDKMIELEEGGQ